jgi:hypothetical protein
MKMKLSDRPIDFDADGDWREAQSPSGSVVPVTVENIVRAETDLYLGGAVRQGALGKFDHHRELVPAAWRGVDRPNRDALYSSAVFDLDAGP